MEYNLCSSIGIDWCVVSYILLFLSFTTLLLSVYHIQAFHFLFPWSWTLLISTKGLVFGLQILRAILMCIYYVFVTNNFEIIYLLQECMECAQYSLVFYYYLLQFIEDSKVTRLIKKYLIGLNSIALAGFLIFLVFLTIKEKLTYDCNNEIRIYLNIICFLMTLVFLIIGLKGYRSLKILEKTKNILIDNERLSNFRYELHRKILICMLITSTINITESSYIVHTTADTCYKNYLQNSYINALIVFFIRFFSSYIFLFACLYVFSRENSKRRVPKSNKTTSIKMSSIDLDNYSDKVFTESRASSCLSEPLST